MERRRKEPAGPDVDELMNHRRSFHRRNNQANQRILEIKVDRNNLSNIGSRGGKRRAEVISDSPDEREETIDYDMMMKIEDSTRIFE